MTVIDTQYGLAAVRFLVRKAALSLELKGLRRSSRARTAYSICKSVYGLKGSRASVLSQMIALTPYVLDGTYPLPDVRPFSNVKGADGTQA